MNTTATSEKLSIREKLGFSAGEYSSSIVWQTLMFFLPAFYTDTFGLTAASVGVMFLVVRFFDAFNDPIMGVIADRTSTRWGKFRPYLLWFAVPYGLLAMLMFSTPDFDYQGKLIYAYITYSLMMIIYTVIMIPYNSWVGVISPNSEERTSVSSYKFVFAYLAGLSVQAMVLPMVKYFGNGDDAQGYRTTMIILGSVSIVFFLITFFSAKERVQPEAKKKSKIKDDLKDLIKNKDWVIIFITSLLLLVYVIIRSGDIMYYFEYYIGDKDLATSFMVVGTIATLLGVLPTKWLSSKIGKKKLFIISLVIIALSQIVFYFTDPDDIMMIFTAQIIFSFASGPTMPLIWSMLADTADYSEWKTHRRATGLIFSATNMSIKSGVAIGGAAIMWMLAFYGYEPNQAQSEESIFGIKMLMSIIPAVIAVLCIIPLLFYKLDEKKLAVIEEDLKRRKEKI
jgi:GPH family glycoside/pentoside/hexuronide:cation symporter